MKLKKWVVAAFGMVASLLVLSGTGCAGTHSALNMPALYSGLHWRLLGPFRGGRALAVTGVPGRPDEFYFGSVDGGVWQSHDAGRTWKPIFDHEPVGSIGAIAVAPSNPRVVYVGTGEADMRSDIAAGDGVYRSDDGGKHWKFVGLKATRHIGKIIVDPKNPDVAYVAALGNAYGASSERGVFRTRDGGKTWKKVLYKNDNTGAIDLAFKPGNPRVIYAALWQTRRPPWGVYPPSNGPGSALYISTDSGRHWRKIRGHGFPSGIGRIGIGVSPADPNRIFVLVDDKNAEAGGLYRSDDGGRSWAHVDKNERIWRRGWYFGGVTVDPKNANVVYVCNTALYRSDDGGRHFNPIKGSPGGDDYHHLWIDPNNPSHLIVGSDQGVVVSLDRGQTWSSWYNQPTAQFYHVETGNQDPYWVYGSQQDTGAAAVPIRTDNRNGITEGNLHKIAAGFENGYIAPDPDDPNIVYGDDDVVTKEWLNTSEDETIDPTLAYPGIYRKEWTLPLVMSPLDSSVLYFANQKIFQTINGGKNWSPISPDLTRKDPGIPPNLGPLTAKDSTITGPRRGTIFAVAPSYTSKNVIWAGTDDGLIWITKDDGIHWKNITPHGLKAWSKISIIEPSHFETGTAYVAVDRHRVDDDSPYIYKTINSGKTWSLVVRGIPKNDFVHVVRQDPVKKNLLYAGTETGVFISFDSGGRWYSIQKNLPVTSIRDIAIHDGDLIVATHGRAFWAIDDISVLRQVNKQIASAKSWLFTPRTATLLRPAAFIGTPLPKDEPAAKNPPQGAIIDYYLGRAAPRGVTISIYDSHGRLVNRYGNSDAYGSSNFRDLTIAPEWLSYISPPTPPKDSSGMHRFVWNLRYPLPKPLWRKPSFYSYDFGHAGLWAPPGRYTIKLKALGITRTKTLNVRSDPRMKVSKESLVSQYKLGVKIQDAQLEAAKQYTSAKNLLERLSARIQSSGNGNQRLKNLRTKLSRLAGVPSAGNPDNSIGRPPANLDNLHYVVTELERLRGAEQSAEAAPTPTIISGVKTVARTLKTISVKIEALTNDANVALGKS